MAILRNLRVFCLPLRVYSNVVFSLHNKVLLDEEMGIQSYVAQTPKSYMAEDLADVRIHSLLLLPATTHVFLGFRDKAL